MPLLDVQRRLTEVGRLRMGHKVNGTRPAKLDHWRLTSRDRQRLEAAALLYGGEVRPWEGRDGEYELFTEKADLPIILLPGQTITAWHEAWSAGGCVRRCDGVREMLHDTLCLCEQEAGDKLCKPTTRLSVMLPDVPGLGCWRLESHGYYAASELAATAAMLEQATAMGELLPARLRIDQRRKIEGGKTTRYAVPVIDIDTTPRHALSIGRVDAVALEPVSRAALPSGPVGFGERVLLPDEVATLDESEATVEPDSDMDPTVGSETPSDSSSAVISDAQRRRLRAIQKDSGVDDEQLRAMVDAICGVSSSKDIQRDKYDALVTAVEAAKASSRFVIPERARS